MKVNYRQRASTALERAKLELASNDIERLKYAALELRMAIEGITYDRVMAFKAEIPPSEFQTWQPKQLMELLLEIDPNADQTVTLSFSEETVPGGPTKEWFSLGTDKVFNLKSIKAHYNALGSFVHLPSIKQIEAGYSPDFQGLRARCDVIVKELEAVLASPIRNITLGGFVTSACLRCEKPIRKRVPHGANILEAKCFHCGADHSLTAVGVREFQWQAIQQKIRCPTQDCGVEFFIWRDEVKPGTHWTCHQCKKAYQIELAVLPNQAPQAKTA